MPELGRGMLFPRSYFADQFTPAQEAAMEAAQAAAEDADDDGFEACGRGICCKPDGHDGECDY